MNDLQKEKMKILLRKNNGKLILKDLMNNIFVQTNLKKLNLTSLEERDILWEKFCFLFKNETSRCVIKIENQQDSFKIRNYFLHVSTAIEKINCNLFLSHFEDIGAIKFNTKSLFKNTYSLLEIDGDSVFVISDDLKNGIMVDYYESDKGSGYTYEVLILGLKWTEKFGPMLKEIER